MQDPPANSGGHRLVSGFGVVFSRAQGGPLQRKIMVRYVVNVGGRGVLVCIGVGAPDTSPQLDGAIPKLMNAVKGTEGRILVWLAEQIQRLHTEVFIGSVQFKRSTGVEWRMRRLSLDDVASVASAPAELELPSVGSALHPHGCTPCLRHCFRNDTTCPRGVDCGYCHVTPHAHTGSRRTQRRNQMHYLKAARELADS